MKNLDQEIMDAFLDKHQNSGMSLRSFAHQQGIDYEKLNYRHRQRREEKNVLSKNGITTSFIKLDPFAGEYNSAPDQTESSSKVVLTFANGLRLEIYS